MVANFNFTLGPSSAFRMPIPFMMPPTGVLPMDMPFGQNQNPYASLADSFGTGSDQGEMSNDPFVMLAKLAGSRNDPSQMNPFEMAQMIGQIVGQLFQQMQSMLQQGGLGGLGQGGLGQGCPCCGRDLGSMSNPGFGTSRSGDWTGTNGQTGSISPGGTNIPDIQGAGRLTQEQKANAAIIVEEGRKVGASDRDIKIALMTALQESGLRNLRGGDRDSAGLFQQRPSCAWGSFAQVTDPRYAARAFFLGAGTNKGLLDIANRNNMSETRAAQAVQRSAFPDAYAKHSGVAEALLRGLTGA